MSSPSPPPPPCRLTMHSPNKTANRLYTETHEESYDEQPFFEKWLYALLCLGLGLVIAIIIVAAGGYAWAFFVVLLFFGVIGILFQLCVKQDSSLHAVDRYGNNRPRRIMTSKLEDRICASLLPHQSALASLESTPEGSAVATTGCLMSTCMLPYALMHCAGCIPATAIASYEIGWKILADAYNNNSNNNNPRASQVLDLHKKWLDILKKAAAMDHRFSHALDVQKVKATKRAYNNAADDFGGMAPDIDLGVDTPEIMDLKDSLDDMKGSLDDLKDAYKELPAKETSGRLGSPRNGIHPIMQRIFLMQIGFSVIFCGIIIGVMAAYDMAGGAVGFFALFVILCWFIWYFGKGKNASFNALEDFVDMETCLRKCLEHETKSNPPDNAAASKDLVNAMNVLRNEIMEAYYDGLGVHLQTHLMMAGEFQLEEHGIPYFWTNSKSKGSTTQQLSSSSSSSPNNNNNNNNNNTRSIPAGNEDAPQKAKSDDAPTTTIEPTDSTDQVENPDNEGFEEL